MKIIRNVLLAALCAGAGVAAISWLGKKYADVLMDKTERGEWL